MAKGRGGVPTPGIIVANTTSNVVLSRKIERFIGPSAGGRVGVARFASGPSVPSASFATGQTIRR